MSAFQDFIADVMPDRWKTKPLWSLFRRQKRTGHANEELLSVYRDHGVIPKSSRDDNHNKESEDLSTYQLVDVGSLVSNKMKAWQGSIAISRFRGIVSPAYYVYKPLSHEHDQFLHYLLRSAPYVSLYNRISKGVRVNQWDLEHEALRNVPVPLPDIDTQEAISTYLDRETYKIDERIAKKENIADLIAAKWEALIHNARQEKDAKWVRLNTVVQRVQRAIGKTSDTTFVPLGLYNRGRGFFKKLETDEEELGDSFFFWVQKGDIVFSGQFAWEGAIGFVTEEEDGCVVSHRYPVYRAIAGVESAYLYAFFRTAHGAFTMDNCSRGAAGRNKPLNTWTIEREQILIPSEQTQKAIARLVTLEAIVRKLTREYVGKALELKSALVTAAVTGQIDVQVKSLAKTAKPDHSKYRVIVGAEIIHRHQGNPKFGHVKLQKLMFLAEAHAGISELQGKYLREAAGPYDRALIEGLDRSLEANGFYRASKSERIDEAVAYAPLAKAGKHGTDLKVLLGTRTEALVNLINLLSDFDKRSVEAIATLYAVWNDAMMDGQKPNDAAIINGVLTEWHSEKGEKFKEADLRHWLDWMKRNKLIPRGVGPKTTTGRLFV
jgi:Type I restriction modification DNA specificity domain